MGDLNINVYTGRKNNDQSSEFLSNMYSFSYVPVINQPSRIAQNSATLIDNIFVNNVDPDSIQGLLYTDILDHLPIFMIAKRCNPKKDKQIVSARDYSDKNVQKFNSNLAITEWKDIYNTTDTETAYSLFHKKFCKVYNECFPLKSFEVKYKTRKPWLTPGLKVSIKKKNKLFLLQKKKPFLFYQEKYKNIEIY